MEHALQMRQAVRDRDEYARIHSALCTLLESNHGHHGIENHVSNASAASLIPN